MEKDSRELPGGPCSTEVQSHGWSWELAGSWHLILLNPQGLSLPRAVNGGVSPLRKLPPALATSGPDTRNFEMNATDLGPYSQGPVHRGLLV